MRLPKSVQRLPGYLRSAIGRSQEASAKELKGTGSFVLDVPLSLVPPAKRGASYVAGKATRAAEEVDEILGEQLAKIPAVGRAFKGRKSYPISRAPGDTVISADIPIARASEPVRKTSRFGVPILALMGAESIRQSLKEPVAMGAQKQAETNGCGHEQLLADAAGAIRELQQFKNEAVEKIAQMELEKQAGDLADRMVRKGLITDEQRSEKVAELKSGETKLAVVEQALELGLTPPSIPRLGVLSGPGSASDDSGFVGAEDMNETTMVLLNGSRSR